MDQVHLTKKQLDLLKYLQDGGKVSLIYIPIIYAGAVAIPYGAFLKLNQEGLVELNSRGDGVEVVTLTDEGCRLTSQRRVSERVVEELSMFR